MSAASRNRRLARFALILIALTVALSFSALNVPRARVEATAEAPPVPTLIGPQADPAAGSSVAGRPPPLICIDPGHSLEKPGMVVSTSTVDAVGWSRARELREVAVNLDVAREIAGLLRARFGDDAVVMTWGEADNLSRSWNALRGPPGDEKLDVMARGAFCARHEARSVASIHTNWFGDQPNGALTGYRDDNDRAFADAVHGTIRDAMRRDPAGRVVDEFMDYGVEQGEWFLTLAFGVRDIPAVILEPVMMSNAEEAQRLLPTIREAPTGRRAQIARIEARALGDWIASTLREVERLGGRLPEQ